MSIIKDGQVDMRCVCVRLRHAPAALTGGRGFASKPWPWRDERRDNLLRRASPSGAATAARLSYEGGARLGSQTAETGFEYQA